MIKVVSVFRIILRIICLFFFFHWITWLTTYDNCTNYRDAIEESIKEESDYNHEIKYGYVKFGKQEKKSIAEIQRDILGYIEQKSKNSNLKEKANRKFEEKLAELKSYENVELKDKKYKGKLKDFKKFVIGMIQEFLKNNNLSIIELDDGRSRQEMIKKDPLKFFLISPLNKISKKLGLLNKYPLGDIIFKLLILKLFLILIDFLESGIFLKNTKPKQDLYSSAKTKEEISTKSFFELLIRILYVFVLLHPALTDKTSDWYLKNVHFLWSFLMVLTFFLSATGFRNLFSWWMTSFDKEKTQLIKKNLASSMLGGFLLFSLFLRRSWGGFCIALCGGWIDFMIEAFKFIAKKLSEKREAS